MKDVEYYKKLIQFNIGDNFDVEFIEGTIEDSGIEYTVAVFTRKNDDYQVENFQSEGTVESRYERISETVCELIEEELSFGNYVEKYLE